MSAGSFPDANVDAIVGARLWEGPIGGVLLFQLHRHLKVDGDSQVTEFRVLVRLWGRV